MDERVAKQLISVLNRLITAAEEHADSLGFGQHLKVGVKPGGRCVPAKSSCTFVETTIFQLLLAAEELRSSIRVKIAKQHRRHPTVSSSRVT